MQPVPIPEDVIKRAIEAGFRSITIGPPEGNDWMSENGIRPVDALVGVSEVEGPSINILVVIEEEDKPLLEKNGGRFWLTVNTLELHPFSLAIFEPDPIEGQTP